MIKYSWIIILLLVSNCQPTPTGHTGFEGKIIKKNWSKSTQSYCAQGSDYFILEQADQEEIVLEFRPKISEKEMDKLVGKSVKIIGQKETKKIESKDNVISQRPVSDTNIFECIVLKVISIEVIN